MRILGIDPGTARTGYGIIDQKTDDYEVINFGCITTKAHTPLQERLNEIAKDIDTLINNYKPDNAAIEEIFFSKNTKTAISVAHSRGVIIQKLNEKNIPTTSYNPLEIKRAICSDGKAQKQQMQKMIQIILKLKHTPSPDDAADALAIAVCHGNFTRNSNLY
jgi:crossover junction endodeoxyribonuclease RuvC